MKKTLVIVMVSIASIALTAGIVKAASGFFDTLTVGRQGVGGVTYFNGTIINNTTTKGVDNPVTFGDNVRIDGRVYRGATAGTSDTLPFIVNDNMEVAGTLAVTGKITASGGIAYSNSASGLTATTVQGAIDELATTLGKAVSGGSLVTGASGVKVAALTATTWKGYAYYIDGSSHFITAPEVTLTFTPTSETQGTYTSTPYNAFHVPSMEQPGEDAYCRLGLTGSYRIVGDKLFVYGFTWTAPYGVAYVLLQVEVRGNTIEMHELTSSLPYVTYLTRQ